MVYLLSMMLFRLVSVGRTLKDKILKLIIEFATIPASQEIGDKVQFPTIDPEDPFLEGFQTIMAVLTPLCTALWTWYTRRLDGHQRAKLQKTIKTLKRKMAFLINQRDEFNYGEDEDGEDDDDEEEFEDAEEGS
mgnify:FL=1